MCGDSDLECVCDGGVSVLDSESYKIKRLIKTKLTKQE